MLEFLPSADDVIAAKMGGHISKAEMEEMFDRIEAAIDANEKTHLFFEIGDYEGFDTEGFGQQMARGWQMVGKLDRFGRVAVVSDTRWIRWATRIESALLPGIAYETYTMDERDQALAWVEGKEELPHRPSFKIIETDSPDVLGFELNGKISADELDAVAEHFNDRLEHGQPKRLLGRIKSYRGLAPAGLMDEDFWAMKRDMIRTLDRYAVVGAPRWMQTMIQALDPMFRVEVRCFESEEEADAWAWLEAEPQSERLIAA
ncbi:STAS/SEC14 domain-containing protein [Parasphingopyxis algicola]|uniref:STAS/SEC14 domain-containing protein n=1 Tax=Parasphingopyxis algicola TaxID=2026624 RepID=UPI001C40A433|nr:STAS/SEC14 domain-containing protein [Parasphingopyxis algicola]